MRLLYIWLFLSAEKTQLANMEFKSIIHFHLEHDFLSCTESRSSAGGDCGPSPCTESGAQEWAMSGVTATSPH